MSYLIYQILKLREFLIAGCLSGLVMMIVFLLWAVRPKRGIAQYGWQAFFFQRDVRDILYLNGAVMQLIFAVTSVAGKVSIDRIHIVLLVVVCLFKFLMKPQILWTAVDMGYSGLLLLLLLVNNMLAGFIWQTRTDRWARTMYFLLCIFIVELAVYYFFKQLQHLLEKTEKRERRKQNVRE